VVSCLFLTRGGGMHVMTCRRAAGSARNWAGNNQLRVGCDSARAVCATCGNVCSLVQAAVLVVCCRRHGAPLWWLLSAAQAARRVLFPAGFSCLDALTDPHGAMCIAGCCQWVLVHPCSLD
jgi:hypothetical protein